jgi:hypothetical protein
LCGKRLIGGNQTVGMSRMPRTMERSGVFRNAEYRRAAKAINLCSMPRRHRRTKNTKI